MELHEPEIYMDANLDIKFFKRRVCRVLVTLTSCMEIFSFSAPANAQLANCESDFPRLLDPEIVLQRVALCNREVIAANRMILARQGDQLVAGQMTNPTLSTGIGTVNPRLGIGSGPFYDKTFDTSLRIEQLIERGGKRDLRSRAANQLVMAAEQDVLDVKRQQGTAALQSMVDLAAADKKVDLLSEVAALYKETLRANTLRKESGGLAPVDAQRQEIDSVHAQLDLEQARVDAARARRTLSTLLAWELQANLLQVSPTLLDSTLTASITPDQLDLGERADIKAARLRLQAALVTRELAQAQSKADVTVGFQLDHWPVSDKNPVGTGDTFSVSVSLPFMAYHHFDGELARATSDSGAARETLQQIEATAKTDWALLSSAVTSAQTRLHLLQDEQLPRSE